MEIYRAIKDNEMLGTVYSKDFAMKRILKMTETEIQEQKEKIEQEKSDEPEQGQDDNDDQGGF